MRNKFLTKILGATLGLAMAIGVGVGVAANNRVAKGLDAGTNTVTFSMTGFNDESTSVTAATDYEGTGSISGGGTISAVARNFKSSDGTIRGNQTNVAGNWSLWNTQAIPGPITAISLTATGTLQKNLYAATGTASQASATTGTAGGTSPRFSWTFNEASNLTYFKLCSNEKFTNGTVTAAVVTVTYAVKYSVTYDKNSAEASGTMTDSNSPYDSNALVTVLDSTFVAPGGKRWNNKT